MAAGAGKRTEKDKQHKTEDESDDLICSQLIDITEDGNLAASQLIEIPKEESSRDLNEKHTQDCKKCKDKILHIKCSFCNTKKCLTCENYEEIKEQEALIIISRIMENNTYGIKYQCNKCYEEIEKLSAEAKGNELKCNNYRLTLKGKVDECEKLKKENNQLKSKVKKLEDNAPIQKEKEKVKELSNENKQYKADLKKLTNENRKLEEDAKIATNKVITLDETMSVMKNTDNILRGDILTLKRENMTLKRELEQIRKTKKITEKEKNMKEKDFEMKLVKFLKKQRNKEEKDDDKEDDMNDLLQEESDEEENLDCDENEEEYDDDEENNRKEDEDDNLDENVEEEQDENADEDSDEIEYCPYQLNCRYGKTCRYKHSQIANCEHFNRGYCRYGNGCRFIHKKGFNKRDTRCRYEEFKGYCSNYECQYKHTDGRQHYTEGQRTRQYYEPQPRYQQQREGRQFTGYSRYEFEPRYEEQNQRNFLTEEKIHQLSQQIVRSVLNLKL